MNDTKKPGLINDLVKGALTTAISVVVTYYVTSAIKTGEYKQTDLEREKQRMEAFEKTNIILSNYISRYDSLHSKYLALLESRRSPASIVEHSTVVEAANSPSAGKISALLIGGSWITPDGTVQWTFNNGKVVVKGIGSYEGFIEASGSYAASAGETNGNMHLSKAYYIPTNEVLKFSLKLSSDGQSLYGTTTDASGNVTAMTLYKN
jgi:hypothetical protein